jgi:hypothetical protein
VLQAPRPPDRPTRPRAPALAASHQQPSTRRPVPLAAHSADRTPGAAGVSAGVQTLDGMAGTLQRKWPAVSAARPLLLPNGPPRCHAERTPTIPTHLDAAVACDSSGTGPVSGCAARQLPCPRGDHRDHFVSTLVAGGERWPDIRPPRIPAWSPTLAWPRVPDTARPDVVVLEAADGQSADGSGSLQLPLLFLKAGPAGDRLRRPSSAGSTPQLGLCIERQHNASNPRRPRRAS